MMSLVCTCKLSEVCSVRNIWKNGYWVSVKFWTYKLRFQQKLMTFDLSNYFSIYSWLCTPPIIYMYILETSLNTSQRFQNRCAMIQTQEKWNSTSRCKFNCAWHDSILYASQSVYVIRYPADTYDVSSPSYLPLCRVFFLREYVLPVDLVDMSSSMPSISPRGSTRNSWTLIASASASRLQLHSRTRKCPGWRRLGGRLGLTSLRRSNNSK